MKAKLKGKKRSLVLKELFDGLLMKGKENEMER